VPEGLGSALGMAGMGVWEHLIPDDIVSCSDGMYQLLGVIPAVGRRFPNFWPERVHPDDEERCRFGYADFLQTRPPAYEASYRVLHEGGHWITVLARGRWMPRSDGVAGHCVVGYVIDVTQPRAAIDGLRAREERFRMSVSALRGIIYDFDLRTRKAERHGLARVLGYSHLEGDDGFDGWLSIVHPDDLPQVLVQMQHSRDFADSYELTYRVRHRDGSWRHMRQRGTYMLGNNGKPIRAFGVAEDITTAEVQREQLQMQSAIIERLSEGVMLVARDGEILFVNPALEKLFGYEPGQMIGRNASMLSFRSAEHFDGLLRTVFEGTENDRTSIIDLEGRRRDDSVCPVQGCFSSMQLGNRRCVVAVMTDITEHKQLERELMQAETRVQQRVGGDLHDGLGQQLTGIAMMLHGLGQRTDNVAAPILRKEVEEIVQLVNVAIGNTRSLARGLSPVRPSREGLTEGFEELINQVHEHYGIRVNMELDLPPALVLDENVATNLYRIAQEAVVNSARHAEAGNIQLRFRMPGPDVELLVTDDGKGFDPKQLARGGMGLRIMRFRAQLVRGYLSVESRPGAGTTLRCRCPAMVDREVT
jgi:two-component system CheB/CheR fusion protein